MSSLFPSLFWKVRGILKIFKLKALEPCWKIDTLNVAYNTHAEFYMQSNTFALADHLFIGSYYRSCTGLTVNEKQEKMHQVITDLCVL